MVNPSSTPQPAYPGSTLNPDDAAGIVQEYFASMDNLPQEVTFLLEEMRIKEDRLQTLLSRLSARTTQLLKSARPQSSSSVSALGPKDQQALEKIDLEWAKVDTVQSEKLALAERLLIIVNRARERGREEFKKVANEEDMSVVDPQEAAVVDKLVSGGGVQQVLAGLNQQAGGVGLVGALQRGMLGSQVVPGPSQAQVLMDEKMKKRKAGPYSNMPPPASPVPVTYTTPSAPQPSRKRRNPSASVEPSQVDERGESESGDGEDDPNGDDKLYCVCQQKSYGEMIGCDNDNCRFEWFHLKCVKLEPPLPEEWWCEECTRLLTAQKKKMKRK